MRSLIPAVAVGKADGKLLVDLGDEEDKYGQGDVPMAIIPNTEEITLLQQDGSFSREELNEALQMGINSCKYLHELQKEALKRAYVKKTPDNGDEIEDDLETDLGEAEIMEDE
jgi:exosome complex component RRP41